MIDLWDWIIDVRFELSSNCQTFLLSSHTQNVVTSRALTTSLTWTAKELSLRVIICKLSLWRKHKLDKITRLLRESRIIADGCSHSLKNLVKYKKSTAHLRCFVSIFLDFGSVTSERQLVGFLSTYWLSLATKSWQTWTLEQTGRWVTNKPSKNYENWPKFGQFYYVLSRRWKLMVGQEHLRK